MINEDYFKDIVVSQISNNEYSSIFFCHLVPYRNVSRSYLVSKKSL